MLKSILWVGALAVCLTAGAATPAAAWDSAGAVLGPYAGSGDPVAGAAHRALAAGVDPALLTEITQRAGLSNLPAAGVAREFQHAEQLAAANLPVAPVLGRYLKGMAMGYPLDRIEAVARDLEYRLAEAAVRVDAVLPAPSTDAARAARLAAIHDAEFARKAGVADDILDRSLVLAVNERDPLEAARAPLYVVGVLAASGLDARQSLDFVSTAWNHGYRGRDLERLGSQVGTIMADGDGESVVRNVMRQIESDATKEHVFQGLDELIGREQNAHRPPGAGPGDDPNHGRGDAGRRGDKPGEGREAGDKRTLGPS